MKESLAKDPEIEREATKATKNINFNYRRSEETIKTLWQANKAFINTKQHKMNPTTYFEKFMSKK